MWNLRGDPITTTETVHFFGSNFLPAPHPPLPEPSPPGGTSNLRLELSDWGDWWPERGWMSTPKTHGKILKNFGHLKKPKVIYHTKLLKHVASNWNLRGPLGGWSSQKTDVSVVNWLFSSPRPGVGYSPSRWPFTHFMAEIHGGPISSKYAGFRFWAEFTGTNCGLLAKYSEEYMRRSKKEPFCWWWFQKLQAYFQP